MPYPYKAGSPSDPNPTNLGFDTRDAAQSHVDRMNALLQEYPEGWNTNYWKTKPEQWILGVRTDALH